MQRIQCREAAQGRRQRSRPRVTYVVVAAAASDERRSERIKTNHVVFIHDKNKQNNSHLIPGRGIYVHRGDIEEKNELGGA